MIIYQLQHVRRDIGKAWRTESSGTKEYFTSLEVGQAWLQSFVRDRMKEFATFDDAEDYVFLDELSWSQEWVSWGFATRSPKYADVMGDTRWVALYCVTGGEMEEGYSLVEVEVHEGPQA